MSWKTVASVRFKDEKRVLQAITKTIDKFGSDVYLWFQKDGMTICVIDPAHIAMIRSRFPKKWFEEWKVDTGISDDERKISVSTEKLLAILGKAKKDDTIELKYQIKEDGTDVVRALSVKIENEKHIKEYTLEVFDASQYWPKYPNIIFDTKINMDAQDFIEYVKEVSDYSDDIVISVSRNTVTFTGNTDDMENVKITPTAEIVEPPEEEFKTIYPLEYLIYLIHTLKIHDRITLTLKKDYPMKISMFLDGVQTDFLEAPRIEE